MLTLGIAALADRPACALVNNQPEETLEGYSFSLICVASFLKLSAWAI